MCFFYLVDILDIHESQFINIYFKHLILNKKKLRYFFRFTMYFTSVKNIKVIN